MANNHSSLDAAFHALADPTRRAVVSRLARGPAPVKELAEPFGMGLPAFMKHLGILERDGLIRTEKVGRVRTCRIEAANLAAAEAWLADQLAEWQARTDRLARYVENELSGCNDNDE